MIQSPCYDTVKKMDCPERSETCHISCPRWADYVKERDAEYENKARINTDYTVGKSRMIRTYLNNGRGRKHGGSTYIEREG